MPEGDTVHKLADVLGSTLSDQVITAAQLHGKSRPDLVSRRVQQVTSKGKHLYIHLDDGRMLRSHLGMYGSWHGYRHGESWRKPQGQATLVLAVAGRVLVCFNAREVEVMDAGGFRASDQRLRLGPDLTRETPEPGLLARRALELLGPDTLVVDLLLDQRVASGIGNVYKSEVLFLEGCSPTRRLGEIGSELFAALYRTASGLLVNNLGGGPRVTRGNPGGRGGLWVYGRTRLPCLRCGTPIRHARLGSNPRGTQWCPKCQPERAVPRDSFGGSDQTAKGPGDHRGSTS